MLQQICFLNIWHFLGVSNDTSFGVLIPVNSTASGKEGTDKQTTIKSLPADQIINMMLKQICFLVIWHFLGVSNDVSSGVVIPVHSTASGKKGNDKQTTI